MKSRKAKTRRKDSYVVNKKNNHVTITHKIRLSTLALGALALSLVNIRPVAYLCSLPASETNNYASTMALTEYTANFFLLLIIKTLHVCCIKESETQLSSSIKILKGKPGWAKLLEQKQGFSAITKMYTLPELIYEEGYTFEDLLSRNISINTIKKSGLKSEITYYLESKKQLQRCIDKLNTVKMLPITAKVKMKNNTSHLSKEKNRLVNHTRCKSKGKPPVISNEIASTVTQALTKTNTTAETFNSITLKYKSGIEFITSAVVRNIIISLLGTYNQDNMFLKGRNATAPELKPMDVDITISTNKKGSLDDDVKLIIGLCRKFKSNQNLTAFFIDNTHRAYNLTIYTTPPLDITITDLSLLKLMNPAIIIYGISGLRELKIRGQKLLFGDLHFPTIRMNIAKKKHEQAKILQQLTNNIIDIQNVDDFSKIISYIKENYSSLNPYNPIKLRYHDVNINYIIPFIIKTYLKFPDAGPQIQSFINKFLAAWYACTDKNEISKRSIYLIPPVYHRCKNYLDNISIRIKKLKQTKQTHLKTLFQEVLNHHHKNLDVIATDFNYQL